MSFTGRPACSAPTASAAFCDRDAPAPETAEHPHHFLVRLPGNQSLHLDLTERAIEVPRLPPAWDGLSLVHLSDFHFNGRVGKPYFQEIVRLSNELQPDLVMLTGDLVDRPRCIDWIPDTLGRLTARYGVYCVLGNHDIRTDAERVGRAMEEAGYATWADATCGSTSAACRRCWRATSCLGCRPPTWSIARRRDGRPVSFRAGP